MSDLHRMSWNVEGADDSDDEVLPDADGCMMVELQPMQIRTFAVKGERK